MSTALVSGCTDATGEPVLAPARASPSKEWSSHLRPADFRGDAAFRLDVVSIGRAACTFSFEAGGTWEEGPVELFALFWSTAAGGAVTSRLSVAVAKGIALHAGTGAHADPDLPGGWSAGASYTDESKNGSMHWIFFGRGLQSQGPSPGLALDATCEGDFALSLVGGTTEMFGFVPGTMRDGHGATLPAIVGSASVSGEEQRIHIAGDHAIVAGIVGDSIATGGITVVTPQTTDHWPFIDPRPVRALDGPGGAYDISLSGATAGDFPAVVVFGARSIRGLEEAISAR